MSPTTIFLSRLIGLFAAIFTACLFVNPGAVSVMASNQGLLIAFGVVTLAAGLAMVLAHNVWSGGVVTIVVTLVGWLILLKGIFLLALPGTVPDIVSAFGLEQRIQLFLIVPFALGLFLAISGFRARPS